MGEVPVDNQPSFKMDDQIMRLWEDVRAFIQRIMLTSNCYDFIRLLFYFCQQAENQRMAYVAEGDPTQERLDLTMCSDPSQIPAVLRDFLAKYKRFKRRNQSLPLYSFSLPQVFYTSCNMDLLKKLLTNFGDQVAGALIELPADGINYPADLPKLTLPALRSLTVVYDKQPYPDVPGGFAVPPFIQTIVSGAANLEDFGVIHSIHCNPTSLILPEALQSLRLQDVQDNPSWCLSGKMDKVQNLLLSISPKLMEQNAVDATFQKLPSLTKAVVWFTPCLEENTENANNVLFLPENATNLKTLHIWNVKTSVFHLWTKRNVFPSVRNLSVTMVKEWQNIHDTSTRWMSMTPCYLCGVSSAFPNLRKLSLLLAGDDDISLPYLFTKFTNLKELNLDFNNTRYAAPIPVVLTSMFLGVTLEEAATFVQQKKWSQSDEIKVGTTNPSILNLKRK